MMEMFVSLEEAQAVKELWRYAMVEHGEQCVKMAGMWMMPKSCVGIWATQWMNHLPVKFDLIT